MIHIIGAGPVGLYLGWKLRAINPKMKVSVYEEHQTIGKPVQCTGLVTSRITELLDLPKEAVDAEISAARIYAPNGKFIDIKLKKPNVLLHRDKFDQHLAKKAELAGCIIKKNMQLKSIKGRTLIFSKGRISLKQHDIVVGADGPRTVVGKHIGVEHELLRGMQAVVSVPASKISFYPYIGKYAWVVPHDKGAKIGVVSKDNTKTLFDSFLKKQGVVNVQAGFLPVHKPGTRIYAVQDKVHFVLVGDAAGQIKNTTGGGLIPGLKSAEVLANAIASGNISKYMMTKSIQPDLLVHAVIAKALSRFSDEDWNALVRVFSKNKLRNVLASVDRESALELALMCIWNEPRLIRYAGKLF